MVIVTQLEARYSKTAFVRIFVNCKQLISLNKHFETEKENLIEKGVLPYNQYIHSKRWVFVPRSVYTKTRTELLHKHCVKRLPEKQLHVEWRNTGMYTQNNREKLILLLILIKSDEFLIR